MTISVSRKFFNIYPQGVITAFRLKNLDINNYDSKHLDNLKIEAKKYLKERILIKKSLQRYANKNVFNTQLEKLILQGEQAFETDNFLQNILNMLMVITGYTINHHNAEQNIGSLVVSAKDNHPNYEINSKEISKVFVEDKEINFSANTFIFLEAVSEDDYEWYLESIKLIRKWFALIFNHNASYRILSIFNSSVIEEDESQLGFLNDGFDQFLFIEKHLFNEDPNETN
ncbi:hypothetical protein NXS15_01525 [Mycoplasma sp. CSL7475-4]|uniref:hypothetical protein n=1 Tax=Mycoplasma sp. CSL7475-4 TaxID=2973942 RepID=UPI00216AF98D|nr:hypothetical protein [Mycoplasma sp. CSL7475-4]MCS4536804.1 hypothetical protein [Mycoplasma sp. CSL7475-4]